MAQIPNKTDSHVRFLTFNVNGLRTFFHYHPFSSMNNSLTKVFDYFQSDIITFQELKTDLPALTRWGKTRHFHSFISIPVKRRGYSGVGCWVRIVDPGDPLFDILQVVKAEEGITGYLKIKAGKSSVRYRDAKDIGIGGYDLLGISDENEALALDSEGRCVMVELKCNTVIVNTYCPANSSQTDEGEEFRLKFLKVLFRRIRNLHNAGKIVVLMGDINVCRDLIDQAEALKNAGVMVTALTKGSSVESSNPEAVKDFIYAPSRPARRLLNEMLIDSKVPELATSGALIDTTRFIQGGDRLKMYTVWNTLKNSRPINYGSRIDFIFVSATMRDQIEQADIWPQVMGSDHCPVYADMRLQASTNTISTGPMTLPPFEARFKHNLNNRDITSMFRQASTAREGSTISRQSDNRVTKAATDKRQRQASIAAALQDHSAKVRKPMDADADADSDADLVGNDSTLSMQPAIPAKESKSFFKMLNGILDKPPECKHGEPTILRTSKTQNNPGKKFWVCSRPKGDANDENASCGFFQWKC
ncbi:LAME_0C05446g1_1 [Lachancea meyersii CBS 8951]|uniref:DNA-(apurinic or apyrimidinic site) endonuclease 2 n=1 Tax=Lachancea meyersii CBS 8951 TaxID=1266667 RepID=A0A1G4J1T3_9SACH|nr:LAME_0C05446g1_1 [Lachancea meyersii CBS 8951]